MTVAGARLDHVVIVVSSLAEASRSFAAAGLTVTPGGRHDEIPTENALVAFADGSHLELLAHAMPPRATNCARYAPARAGSGT